MQNSRIQQTDLDYLSNNSVEGTFNGSPLSLGDYFDSEDIVTLLPINGAAINSASLDYMDFLGRTKVLNLDAVGDGTFSVELVGGTYENFTVDTVESVLRGYTVTQNDLDDIAAANAVLYIDGVPAVVGSRFSASPNEPEIRFICATDYQIIKSVLIYSGLDNLGRPIDDAEQNMIIENDSTESYYAGDEKYTGFIFESEFIGGGGDGGGGGAKLTNIYVGNTETFKSAFDNSYILDVDDGEISQLDAVQSYKYYPFEIPEYLLTGIEDIQIGEANTGDQAETVNHYITIDLGIINIPFTGSVDSNKKFVIYPPYLEPIIIDDVSDLLGYDLNFSLSVELLSGDVIFQGFNAKDGEQFISSVGTLGIEIPYKNAVYVPYNNSELSSNIYNLNNKLKIELLDFNNELINSSKFTIPVLDNNNLEGVSGFIMVDEIGLNIKVSLEEKEMIYNYLKSGVIKNA